MSLSPRRGLRQRFYALAFALLAGACLWTLAAAGDLSLGRNPWENLSRTAAELSRPSFIDAWFGETRLEYRADDGRVLRVENRQETERAFLAGLARAVWSTLQVATLGSLLAAVIALPFGVLVARNMALPRWVAAPAKLLLDTCRAIHSLVFALVFVGIVGLGPMAGILAIAAHSLGTYGKLYAEAIETMDRPLFEAALALGGTPVQGLRFALWPAVMPQWISTHLYVWEYNVRDSTVLGLIGAGGLGLLVSEAVSLFQWGRLATILLAIVALVFTFDAASRRIRTDLLSHGD
jgi:phosphonate transport system permease protein